MARITIEDSTGVNIYECNRFVVLHDESQGTKIYQRTNAFGMSLKKLYDVGMSIVQHYGLYRTAPQGK